MSNGADLFSDNWEEIDEAGNIRSARHTISPQYATAVQPSYTHTTNTIPTTQCSGNVAEAKQLKPIGNERKAGAASYATGNLNALGAVATPLDVMSATFQPVGMQLHKTNVESQVANAATQPMQKVKILRRPTQPADRRHHEPRPKAPLKTLQQREQEYAEARLRILGSAKNPEDDEINGIAESTTPKVQPHWQ